MSHTLHTQHTHNSSHILHTTQHHTLVFSHAPTLFYLIKHLPCNDDAITYINIVVKEERDDVSKQEYDRILYFLPSVCTKCISKYQNYSRTFPRTTLGRSSKKNCNNLAQLSFCNNFKNFNPYIFATWWRKSFIFQTLTVWSNRNQSLKYQMSTTSGCRDTGIKKSEFAAKNHFLFKLSLHCFCNNTCMRFQV